jgi:FKBP-type peptidyl-prolyl cis-trans isomerase (trigger factor)
MKSISQYRMSLEDYLKAINKTNEEFYNEAKDLSEKELKKLLIIDEIIKNENIKASKKDIENEINSIKEQYKGQELADDETLFSIVENNIKRRNSIEHLIKISKSSDKNRKK